MSLFHHSEPDRLAVRRPIATELTLGAVRRDVEVRYCGRPSAAGAAARIIERATVLEAVAAILDDLAVTPANLAVRTVAASGDQVAIAVTPPSRQCPDDPAASIYTAHFAGRLVAFVPRGLSAFELELALSWFCATCADPRDLVQASHAGVAQ